MPEYSKSALKVLKSFGSVIRSRRDVLGMSQEELAEKANLHRTYIGGVEQGRRNVSLLNIIKLTQALDVEPEMLFEDMSNLKKNIITDS